MIEKIMLSPMMLARILGMKKDIYKTIGTFSVEALLSKEPIPRSEWKNSTFIPFPKGNYWAKERFECCVFRFNGIVPSIAKGKQVVALLKLGGEGEVYRDGEAVCGVTPIMSTIDIAQPLLGKQIVPLFDSANGGESVTLEVDCGHNGYCGVFLYNPRLVKADMAIVDEERRDYYYDCIFLLLTLSTRGSNRFLNDDKIKEITDKFNESYIFYRDGEIQKARETLSSIINSKQTEGVEYSAIGHGHLDLAWKWPIREGRRKAVRTFSNVLNFQEKYDFVFGASQAQLFQWIEEDEPELFERVKTAIAEGKIELQGGMWAECDCNVPCGESLIRQFLYGGEFFENHFNKNSDVVWLPDVFGFPHTFPQIAKGVGKKYFMTIKLNWNEYNKFPYQAFNWVAPDGSRIISHMAPEGTYCCSASPIAVVKSDVRNIQKETGNALMIYGISDGGGGPGEGHLEMLKRAGNKFMPKVKTSSSVDFFRKLESANLPDYNNELYLEKHQGTLTSQADNKKYNRLAERKLHNLEWLETVDGKKYANRDWAWKRILTNQFHNILPGSGITRVHRESVDENIEVCLEIDKEIAKKIKDLSVGKGKTVLNPAPFAVHEKVVINGVAYMADCGAYEFAPLKVTEKSVFVVGKDYIENDKIRVTVDLNSGNIVSVLHKATGKELGTKRVHTLVVHSDPMGRFDAWDINRHYLTKSRSYPILESVGIEVFPDKAVIINHYRFNKSKIHQQIYIKDSEIVFFDTQVDWRETHKMLRAEFSPSVWSDEANYDIQFGSIMRSTNNNTKIEKAQYEVCGHYYASVGDDRQGYLSVMNNCKYGYRVKEGVISLNLLRSPVFPDKNCDKGKHFFKYALSYASDMKETVKRGYLFNNPLIITEEDIVVKMEFSIDNSNLIIETIKLAEKGEGVVLRVYERYGKQEIANFIMPEGYKVYETDMLERNEKSVENAVFAPHEIKTFIFRR